MCDNDENVETIIGGDYNCTLNNAIDRYNCTTKIDIGQIDLKNVMENLMAHLKFSISMLR